MLHLRFFLSLFFLSVSQELPLYCSGGLRFFWDNKFDHAMVAFLDCVQQFKEEVEKGDTGFCLPYRSDNQDDARTVFPRPAQQGIVSCIRR